MDLTAFGIQQFELFLLVFARSAGIFAVTPLFWANQTPMQVRVVIALGLTIVFLPMVNPTGALPTEILPLMMMVAREAAIGLIIGFVCTMVLTAIQVAGELMDAQSGFRFASMVDPNGTPTSIAARFHFVFAGLFFFATNSHHILIRGMADSFYIAPVGEFALNPAVAGGAIELFSALFMVAVRIAAPVVAAVFLADLALAVSARVVPQMHVLIVGLPLKLGVGIAGMLVTLPVVASTSQGMFGDLYGDTMNLLRLIVS